MRSWEPSVGAFLLADSSYLDLLRLVPRDLQNIAEDELELEIYQFTKVLKTVGCDLKFLSMRFPLSLERQKAVLLHHARQAGDETRIRWLERQIRELEVAETNISSQHFYLAYWGKDADTLRKNHDMIRKYAATGYQPLVEEIDARQKAKVLEKLANMNTIIDNREGVSTYQGISLKAEKPSYPLGTTEIRFTITNHSGEEFVYGDAYSITAQGADGNWFVVPTDCSFTAIGHVLNDGQSGTITAHLFPDILPNKPGVYRFFYEDSIDGEKVSFMATFELK